MAKKFSALHVAFAGFCIAAVGAIAGFIGFGIERQWVACLSFAITVLGVAIGFIGVIYGWITCGRAAIKGGVQDAEDLAAKIKRLWKYDDHS
ncbi:hypothetical protein [Vogesella sp. AC12]|uniref:hypothetical protein n=1 Tax=Vogesella sp. AC12 TaxID=2950550 RepID=UPI002108C6B4|nr:hypothetical protein [Vogesella sp. AC12]MCQ4144007.1 hypothetical protein [Vogesella sp. AC12]